MWNRSHVHVQKMSDGDRASTPVHGYAALSGSVLAWHTENGKSTSNGFRHRGADPLETGK
jgi:hypothetical protein